MTAAPPSKRARTTTASLAQSLPNNNKQPAGTTTRERLFAPFRSLGHISTSVPLHLQTRSSKHLNKPSTTVTTSLGKNFAIYDGERLKLLFIGPGLGDKEIESLTGDFESTFVAYGNKVGRFVRGKQVGSFITTTNNRTSSSSSSSDSDSDSSSDDDSEVAEQEEQEEEAEEEEVLSELVLFGNSLIALSKSSRKMFVWDIPRYSNPASKDPTLSQEEEEEDEVVTPYTVLQFPHGFTPTKIVHPSSYLNKVVVASREGELSVWNVRTGTLIHTFPLTSLLPGTTSTSTTCSITALSQSPAIDVLGIGFSTGHCCLFDVRMGELLGKVKLEGEGAGEISCITFRKDDLAQTLAIGTTEGHLALFDLNSDFKLLHLVRSAHEGKIGGLEWVVGQPLLMSSGRDNSLKQWLLDTPTSSPRLLKQRSGHHEPPHLVRYYGQDGKSLLTAGKDHSLRFTSVVRDSRGYELSQGSIAKKATRLDLKPSSLKLPLITSLSYSDTRSKDWDDVVTVSKSQGHQGQEGEDRGRTWSVQNKRLGKFTFATLDGGKVTVSTVTQCGNFGLVGSDRGQVVGYNMQSGLRRKLFQLPVNNQSSNDLRSKNVTGVAVDALNRIVVVSTLKGIVYFFDFQTMKLLSTLTLSASITSIHLQRDNSLLAAICDDLTVRVIDIETKRVVRELTGSTKGTILDLAFSSDSRWIVTTSQDSIVRTFDVPTGNLIDAFRVESVCTSLSFSPTGDFLATTHVDSVGVYLWANRAQFEEVSLLNFVEDEGKEFEKVELPTVQGLSTDASLSSISAPTDWSKVVQPYTTPDQLASSLVTLSLMPRSKWQTLLNLETIKQRNKPKEAPKQPERAPFFLPTLPGTDNRFDFGTTNDQDKKEKEGLTEEGKKRKLDYSVGNSIETEFVRRLLNEKEDSTYQSFFEYMKSLSPSSLDLEIRSLTTLPHLRSFLQALLQRLKSRRDFEAVETFLSIFLKIHSDVLISNPQDGIRVKLLEIQTEQKKEAERLIDLTHYSLGTLAFLRNVALT
ncbi:hypothetical protein JCM5350_002741 [Sporobolomyces pararoseus]